MSKLRVRIGDLKRVIREEAQRLVEMPADPTSLNTMDTDARETLDNIVSDAMGDIAEAFIVAWEESYDPADPSMAEVGREGWLEQCASAGEILNSALRAEVMQELMTSIANVASQVENDLINGEFY